MFDSLRSLERLLLAIALTFSLVACASGSAGLNAFQSSDGRYGFFYPTGWTRVAVNGGPEVVFHDLINSDETLSLVVSKVGENNIELESLGTPEQIGQRLISDVIAPEGTGRDVALVEAKERHFSGHDFYDLEYSVKLPDRNRHELATVVLDRGYLYTFAASTNENRWPKVEDLFKKVISSFEFLI